MINLARKLIEEKDLPFDELVSLILDDGKETLCLLQKEAVRIRDGEYGRSVILRALIEFSSYCRCNCCYCGLRCGNRKAERYRISDDEILSSVESAYSEGLRTIVLQSGEDPYFTDERLSSLIGKIVSSYDVRITLSVGERSRESYERLYRAGARRYLLRHESITESHFSKLHPAGQGLSKRIKALMDLKDIGYQTGCGFMVGSPYQSAMDIARDLMFIKSFKPHMVGIGPFIAARNTPFENFESGSAELTLKLLAIIRIMNPKVLLPSTTALASIVENGDLLGLESGANVIMPNFTPLCVSGKYSIYDNKKRENTDSLKERLGRAGYSIPVTFGDSHVDA